MVNKILFLKKFTDFNCFALFVIFDGLFAVNFFTDLQKRRFSIDCIFSILLFATLNFRLDEQNLMIIFFIAGASHIVFLLYVVWPLTSVRKS